MMRLRGPLLWIPATALVAAFASAACGCSPEYSPVYDTYYQALVFPEKFDEYVAENQSTFDQEFYSHLADRKAFFQDAALNHYDFCRQFADPEIRRQCEQENEPGKVFQVLDAIGAVTRYRTRFGDTLMGAALIIGKEALGAGMWEQLQKDAVPHYRPYLVTK